MLHLRASSIDDTHAVAACIASLTRAGDLIVLAGEMGAGKTAFAQGFGAALGVAEPMTSPTFTLVHSYDLGRITLHHADIYRLNTRNEVDDLALSELLEYDGIVLLEWGDVVAQSLGEHLECAVADYVKTILEKEAEGQEGEVRHYGLIIVRPGKEKLSDSEVVDFISFHRDPRINTKQPTASRNDITAYNTVFEKLVLEQQPSTARL